MRKLLLLALATGALHAALIRGTVVENQTGRPLARALVVVRPVTGTAAEELSARTNVYGAFEFPPVAGGAYLLTASRRAFAPIQYGQKRWNSAGVPVLLEDSAATYLTIRLPRYGAVAGTIMNENEVGLPEHDVVVYTNTRPPKLMARGKTDNRGMYRISGLDPGSYLVRTTAKLYDDGGYLPTFGKETATVDQAYAVEVTLDEQVEKADIRPLPGRLFTVAGQVISPGQTPFTVTMVSDTGSVSTTSDARGNFQLPPAAPGQYEFYAQTAGVDYRTGKPLAGFQPVALDRDRSDISFAANFLPEVLLSFEEGQNGAIDTKGMQVMARRKDLSGEGIPEVLRPATNGRVSLLPGRWELMLAATPQYYVGGFAGPGPASLERGRADGWNEIVSAGRFSQVKFVLSSSPGAVHGMVKGSGSDVVAGAPVFLESYDLEKQRRLTDLRVTRTDMQGRYQFAGLAPGTYRVLSSFEYQMPDSMSISGAAPKILIVEAGRDAAQDLDLYVLR